VKANPVTEQKTAPRVVTVIMVFVENPLVQKYSALALMTVVLDVAVTTEDAYLVTP
jgi:hypothetical protein